MRVAFTEKARSAAKGEKREMQLVRLHAYSVQPRRTDEDDVQPDGGRIAINRRLREVINQNIDRANFNRQTPAEFNVDPRTRSNETRDLVRQYCFGNIANADDAALELAQRLAEAMDHRSHPCLFVVAGMRDDDRRRITVWTFPQEQAFRFRIGDAGPRIQVLTDIFSQSSTYRKAALFEGRNLRNEFLSGRVLDFQATRKDVAEFWIERFLQCRLSIASDTGTRLLAQTLRKTNDACSEVDDQQQILSAAMAIRTSPQRRWSLNNFAETFLDGDVRQKFLSAAPNNESATAIFDFSREEFDRNLGFGVFKLNTGVWVSSPFEQIDQSVTIEDGEDRRLTCTGTIVDESVRSRRG